MALYESTFNVLVLAGCRVSQSNSESSLAPGMVSGFDLQAAAIPARPVGPAGDLYIIVRVDPHPVFRREGDDIYITAPVMAWEAALGAKIEVPTIDGRAMLRIPQGTQSGQKLRMREKGVNSATKEGTVGDQIVEVKIVTPRVLTLRPRTSGKN